MKKTEEFFRDFLEEDHLNGEQNKLILNLVMKFLTSKSKKDAIDSYRKFYEKLNTNRTDLFDDALDFAALAVANNENSEFREIINYEFVYFTISRLKNTDLKVNFSDFYFYFKCLYFSKDLFQHFNDEKVEKILLSIKGFDNFLNTIKGIIELRRNKYESGLNLLTTALYEDSDTLPALIELVAYYLNHENFNIADGYCRKIFEQIPNNEHLKFYKEEIYFTLIHCAIKLKDYNRAILLLKESLKFADWHYDSYNNLAFASNEVGRYQEALKFINKGLKLDPTNDRMCFIKVDILKNLESMKRK